MKKSFLLYSDQIEIFNGLTDEQAGVLIKHIYDYSMDHSDGYRGWLDDPTSKAIVDPVVRMAFTAIKIAMDRDHETYLNICERNRINGLKGGRPPEPRKPNGLSGNPKNPRKPKKADSDSGSDKKKKVIKKFLPPTLKDVIQYFSENGYTKESARKAYQFYSIANWHDSKGNPVKNWKQKMISVWFKEENKIQGPATSSFDEYQIPVCPECGGEGRHLEGCTDDPVANIAKLTQGIG